MTGDEQSSEVVLSIFPGADLLGRGFELAGYCVVRGPDIAWGQDIRDFLPARHVFKGVIGGSPCQGFSSYRHCFPSESSRRHSLEMLAEYVRVVQLAAPDWWLLENVPEVPDVTELDGYTVQRFNLAAKDFGLKQNRLRCFQFGSRDGKPLVIRRQPAESGLSPCACASEGRRHHRRGWAEFCQLQGLPAGFDLPGLSRGAKYQAVGNGVPVPVARAVATAIRTRSVTEWAQQLCICGCARPVHAGQTMATPACRKRMQRRRDSAGVTVPGPVTSSRGASQGDLLPSPLA
jgi:DNA (cytosine-5)-methyltransferase 1